MTVLAQYLDFVHNQLSGFVDSESMTKYTYVFATQGFVTVIKVIFVLRYSVVQKRVEFGGLRQDILAEPRFLCVAWTGRQMAVAEVLFGVFVLTSHITLLNMLVGVRRACFCESSRTPCCKI